MKKTIPFIVAFCALLITCLSFSFEINNHNLSYNLHFKTADLVKQKSFTTFDSDDSYLFYNYDNDETENLNPSISKKNEVTPKNDIRSNSITANVECSKSFSKNYYTSNFSRIPRFDYISLRVLRI